jgi:hypothetical protein
MAIVENVTLNVLPHPTDSDKRKLDVTYDIRFTYEENADRSLFWEYATLYGIDYDENGNPIKRFLKRVDRYTVQATQDPTDYDNSLDPDNLGYGYPPVHIHWGSYVHKSLLDEDPDRWVTTRNGYTLVLMNPDELQIVVTLTPYVPRGAEGSSDIVTLGGYLFPPPGP